MGIRDRHQLEARGNQQTFHQSLELLAVLQGTWRMEGDASGSGRLQLRHVLRLDHFAQIPGELGDPCGLVRVSRFVPQVVTVVLHQHPAAARRRDHGFSTLLDMGPPGVDVGAHEGPCLLRRGQVLAERTATAGAGSAYDGNAQAVQNGCRGHVGTGRHGRLHATVEDEHAPRSGLPLHRLRRLPGGHLLLKGGGHEGPHRLTELDQGRHASGKREHLAQHPAPQPICCRALHALVDDLPPDVQQAMVVHTGRTGGHAAHAGETAVQVLLSRGGGFGALQDLFDLVDASPRPVQLVPEKLVSGTGGGTETTVDAGPKDPVSLPALGGFTNKVGKVGLHARMARRFGAAGVSQNLGSSGNGSLPWCTCMAPSSAQRCSVGTALPGFRRPCESKAAFKAWNWASSGAAN